MSHCPTRSRCIVGQIISLLLSIRYRMEYTLENRVWKWDMSHRQMGRWAGTGCMGVILEHIELFSIHRHRSIVRAWDFPPASPLFARGRFIAVTLMCFPDGLPVQSSRLGRRLQ